MSSGPRRGASLQRSGQKSASCPRAEAWRPSGRCGRPTSRALPSTEQLRLSLRCRLPSLPTKAVTPAGRCQLRQPWKRAEPCGREGQGASCCQKHPSPSLSRLFRRSGAFPVRGLGKALVGEAPGRRQRGEEAGGAEWKGSAAVGITVRTRRGPAPSPGHGGASNSPGQPPLRAASSVFQSGEAAPRTADTPTLTALTRPC